MQHHAKRYVLPFLFATFLGACASTPASDSGAHLYAGFGNYERPVSTRSSEAQRWFDQGMQLLFGFNHDEAIRSFKEASRLDPDCAMAWWGIAYANGLHINNPQMGAAASEAAYEAAQEALARIGGAAPVERALIEAEIPRDFLKEYVFIADGFTPTALHVLIRFGRWQEILDEQEPAKFQLLGRTLRHYARGVALANLDRTAEARRELAAFDALGATIPDDWTIGHNPVEEILPLARGMLLGEIQFREGERERAFESLRAAVLIEDRLVYDEPPGWMQPVRHALGALLVVDERYEEARAVYLADLERHPSNGWALLGLEQALTGLGRVEEARAAARAREAAWSRADQQPAASCYCGERP